MLQVERKRRQVHVLARNHDLMHRRVAGWHLDHRLRIIHAPHVFVRYLPLADAEGGREPPPAARHRGDQFELLRTHAPEKRCLGRGLDDGAEPGQGDRLFMYLDLADLDQAIDERPEPEFLEIDTRARHRGFCLHRLPFFA